MTAVAPTILIVEDDAVLGTFLADNLAADGYEPLLAETVRDGLRELEFRRPTSRSSTSGCPTARGST